MPRRPANRQVNASYLILVPLGPAATRAAQARGATFDAEAVVSFAVTAEGAKPA